MWAQKASRGLPDTHFQAFLSPGQNVCPECFERHIFKHFQAQARMWIQKASRDTFSSISKPRPECKPRRLPETHFQTFPSRCQNVGPECFQRHIFKHFQAQARRWAQRPSRHTFSSISKPRPECEPRTLPETHFQAFPSPSQNVSPESFQTHILKHFQAQARMSAQNDSRETFSSISKPRPECGPRRLPETHFQTFPSPGQNMGPEDFQRHIFKHFQAQARM